jgi:hypothetical protein
MHFFRQDKFRFIGGHPWVLRIFPLLIAALLVAHGVIPYRLVSRMTFPAILAFIVLLVIKHLGLFGSIYAALRRRVRMKK